MCAGREAGKDKMSFMRGDLLTKTRKLVKGLAKAKPLWLKAMEEYALSLSLASASDSIIMLLSAEK